MGFLREIGKFEEIWKQQVADEISNIKAASFSHCWLWHWVNSLITNREEKHKEREVEGEKGIEAEKSLDIIRRARNKRQREWKKQHYIKLHIEKWESVYNSCKQYRIKLNSTRIGHSTLSHRDLMSRNEQPPTCSMQTPETNFA